MQALDYITTLGISYEEYERNLPALILQQYVARSACNSNEYLILSRAKLAISLAHIGYLQEAIVAYLSLIQQKDVIEIGKRTSTHYEVNKGLFSAKFEEKYNNSVGPSIEPNKTTLNELMNSEIDKKLFSSFNLAIIRYARVVIIFRSFENECVSGATALERQDERVRALKFVEEELKAIMKILSKLEEIAKKKNEIETDTEKLEDPTKVPEELASKKDKIKKLIEEEGMDISTSGEKEYIEVKNYILTLMVHCRLLLAKSYEIQGLFTDAYNTLNTGVVNLRKYCFGLTKVETGTDNKSEIAMIPEGVVAGIGSGAKDKKGAPAKEEKKKVDKKKQPAEEKKEEGDTDLKAKKEEEQKAAELNSTLTVRSHINSYLWFKLQTERRLRFGRYHRQLKS